jgi:nucleoid-associated protein YgaU
MDIRCICAGLILAGLMSGCMGSAPQANVSEEYEETELEFGNIESQLTQEGEWYIIKRGDTLSEISQRKYGTSKLWRKILEANPGLDPRAMSIGQKILIPPLQK